MKPLEVIVRKRLSGNFLNPWISREEAVELLVNLDQAIRFNESSEVDFGEQEDILVEVVSRVYASDIIKSNVPEIEDSQCDYDYYFISLPHISDILPKEYGYERKREVCFCTDGGKDVIDGIIDGKSPIDINRMNLLVNKRGEVIQPADIVASFYDGRRYSVEFHYSLPYFKKSLGWTRYRQPNEELFQRVNNPNLIISVFQYSPWTDKNGSYDLYNRLFSIINGEKDSIAIYGTAVIQPKFVHEIFLSGPADYFDMNKLKELKKEERAARRLGKMLLDYLKEKI